MSDQPDQLEPLVDLRVDRSGEPVAELARLLDVDDAYAHFFAGTMARLSGDPNTALFEVEKGLASLPDDGNLLMSRATSLLACGDIDAARHTLRRLVDENPNWTTVLRGFVARGIIVLPDGVTVDELVR